MIIFAEHTSPRLIYILNYIFLEQLGISYNLTHTIAEYDLANTPKISYSRRTSTVGLNIIPEGLLFENTIRLDKPEINLSTDLPMIFVQLEGDFSFDVFSAVFWFLSRYEEYQNFNPDTHNRFPASESFAYKNGLLLRPIVEEWLKYFAQKLKLTYPSLEFKTNKFKALNTIDVDSPWCYKNKGWYRNGGGMLRDVLKGNFNDVALRIKVLLGVKNDPWFSFDWVLNLHKNANYDLIFFMHVGDYGKFDKTVKYNLKAFKGFVQNLANNAKIGLHPSYSAASNTKIFKKEIGRLYSITNKEVQLSRQHFLVFSIEKYYSTLIELGITNDYSMGFADKAGFRAGTSKPFYFYNLKQNQETKLLVHPFVIMDRTLKTYENQSVEIAFKTVKTLIDEVLKVDGTFVSLWHNESLSNNFEWVGWRKVYQDISDYLESLK